MTACFMATVLLCDSIAFWLHRLQVKKRKKNNSGGGGVCVCGGWWLGGVGLYAQSLFKEFDPFPGESLQKNQLNWEKKVER